MPRSRTNPRRGLYHALCSAVGFWSRLSNRTRFIVFSGAGALILAAVLLAVLLTRPDAAAVRQASAEGLPMPAGTPQATATLQPLPTPPEPIPTTPPD
ncbi:MAG: hypothetical protein GXW96_11020, partial [Christensenellaceae bacterium]|nr:hypothetical protein [Christensenellaceae bacterium]